MSIKDGIKFGFGFAIGNLLLLPAAIFIGIILKLLGVAFLGI